MSKDVLVGSDVRLRFTKWALAMTVPSGSPGQPKLTVIANMISRNLVNASLGGNGITQNIGRTGRRR